MLANYKIESSNYILRIASKDKGRLLLQNKQSETLVQLGELKRGLNLNSKTIASMK